MNSAPRYNLIGVIGEDIVTHCKIPLLLLIFNVVSAIGVIYITYSTRALVEQKEQLTLEYHKLNIEWRNLILEEYVFADHNRITEIATKQLNMRNVGVAEEQVVVNK